MLHHLSLLLLAIALTSVAPLRGETPPAKKDAERERIAKLIQQLGDDNFAQRKSATDALERIGMPALPALRIAASTSKDGEIRQRAGDFVTRIENGLDQLLADYRAYGLPLPPEKAPLVRFKMSARGIGFSLVNVGGGSGQIVDFPPRYDIGFLIKPALKDRAGEILCGTQILDRTAEDVGEFVDRKKLTLIDTEATQNDTTAALILAVQMHSCNRPEAKAIFEMKFKNCTEQSPRVCLRLLAWGYWDERLVSPEGDHWPAACEQMKVLLANGPELDTPENRGLLQSLEAALIPSKAKLGSIEALIDNLINVRQPLSADEPADQFARVPKYGFDAVPALLEHLDDIRLTRHRSPAWKINNHEMPANHNRVGDLVRSILGSVAGVTARNHWPNDWKDRTALKALAKAWWEKARKQGEEAYFAANVLPPLPKKSSSDVDRYFPEAEWPEFEHVRLLRNKYPHRLLTIYRDVLENRPQMQTWPITQAISDSTLPNQQKLDLFLMASKNKNLDHRCTALFELKKLDTVRFDKLLVEALDNLPKTPTAKYGSCSEARFAKAVCLTDDPRAWQALERAARRADAGLRLEILNHLDDPIPTAAQRRLRLALLGAFLDDDTMRDIATNPKMYESIYAGSAFARLEVRNFAAMRITAMAGKPIVSTPDWTAEQWAKLREQMWAAVKRELADGGKP